MKDKEFEELKVGDKVVVVTMMGATRYREEISTIVKVHKNGNYKVMYDKLKNNVFNFRSDGTKCGENWKDWTTQHLELPKEKQSE